MFSFRFNRKRIVASVASASLFATLVTPASISASTPDTYAMVGYEIYFAADQGVFAGTGSGYDGPRELSGWYTSVYHTLSIAPGNVTGGVASLQRIDGVQISGYFSGGDVVQTNAGEGCTDQTYSVTALLTDVSRTDEPGAYGTAVLSATLTHYQAWFWGSCYVYSARVDGTITVNV